MLDHGRCSPIGGSASRSTTSRRSGRLGNGRSGIPSMLQRDRVDRGGRPRGATGALIEVALLAIALLAYGVDAPLPIMILGHIRPRYLNRGCGRRTVEG